MLGEPDLKTIQKGLSGFNSTLILIFHPADVGDAFHGELLEVAKSIAASAGGGISLQRGKGEGLPDRPALTLSCRGRGNINYLALPQGPEGPPFVEALLALPRGATGLQGEWPGKLRDLKIPAELPVFMSPSCPHCPQAVRAANSLALASPLVTSIIVDVQQFPELARQYAIRSVPMTIIDGGISLVGVVQPDLLVEKLLSRGSEAHERETFLSLLEGGRFSQAAGFMAGERGPDYFLETWRTSTTATRIGLLLLYEEVEAEESLSMKALVPGLIALLESADAAFRGDTADLLGRIGDPFAAGALRALRNDPNPDVAEIAEEALEELEAV